MIKLLMSAFFLVISLSGCGWDGTPTRSNDFTPLTSIEISGRSTIARDTSTLLTVKGNFSGLYTRDVTGQVSWSSSAPGVAGFITAANPNRVTGIAPGTATLTATVAGISLDFIVTVSSATVMTLTITPAVTTVAKGLKTNYTVSGDFSDSTVQDLTFDATWSSSNSAVATISNAVGSKGVSEAVAAGTATISAAFGGITATLPLTVTEPVLQTISVTPANPSVLTLSTIKFTATGHYSDGSTADISPLVTWSSAKADVASIGSDGTATTLTQGTTAINATLAGVSGASNLKTTGGNLATLSVTPLVVSLVKGTSGRIAATGTFTNGSTRDVTGAVSWTTANATIATVTASGGNLAWLNALAVTPAGVPAIITARHGSAAATTSLTITAPTLNSMVIFPTTLDLTANTVSRFTVTAYYNDGTSQNVTASSDWTSSAAATAVVGNSGLTKGRVSGVAAGTATIKAVYGGSTITAIVTVKNRTLQDLVITNSSTVTSGNQVPFTATASYSDGSSVDVTENATWELSPASVAILADSQNQPGQIVAVDSGTATLTASFGGKTKTATITVP